MKRIHFLIVGFLLATNCKMAFAGTTPPEDFMALEVCLKYSDSSCTLKEFVNLAFSPDATRTWEKTDANQWTLTLNIFDKVSKNKSKTITAFRKEESDGKSFAVITRMISNDGKAEIAQNGQVYETADAEVSSGMLPSVVVPMIQVVNEKTGRAAQAREKSKQKTADAGKKELKKDFDAILGNYESKDQKFDENMTPYAVTEKVSISKISNDTVNAKIEMKCSKKQSDPLKTFDENLKLEYSSGEGRYTSALNADGCKLLVKFGHGQMDSIQSVEFVSVDKISKSKGKKSKGEAGCCIHGKFAKSGAE